MKRSNKGYKRYNKSRPLPYQIRKAMSVARRAPQETMFTATIRSVLNQTADSGGNLASFFPVENFASQGQHGNYGSMWRECKCLRMSVTFIPSQFLVTQNANQASVWLVPIHGLALSTTGANTKNLPNARFFSACDPAPKSVTWYAREYDSIENQFFPTNNTISSSQGGVQLYTDGSPVNFGLYYGEVIITWKVLYKGQISVV